MTTRVLLALCAAVAVASSAEAATLSAAGGVATYTGAPGGTSNLRVDVSGDGIRVDRLADQGDTDPITPGAGCVFSQDIAGGQRYLCAATTTFDANLGDRDDRVVSALPGTLAGQAGADRLTGGSAPQTLLGGDGDDRLFPLEGADTADGGPGDDEFNSEVDGAADVFIGGSGRDSVGLCAFSLDGPAVVRITLDGVADDGLAGEGDDAGADIEDAAACSREPVGSEITGSALPNALYGSEGPDTIDGREGADHLVGGAGADRLLARDGDADFVNCGADSDTAVVDQHDTLADCESVERADVQFVRGAPLADDRPPAVTWLAPAAGATLARSPATPLEASATDDGGIVRVVFLVGDRVVCTAFAAPYRCGFTPGALDAGRAMLTAVAHDTSGQTATAVRTVVITRGRARSLSASVTPRRLRRSRLPAVATVRGSLGLPAGLPAAEGCTGVVEVALRRGRRVVARRRAPIRADCTYRARLTVATPGRLRVGVRMLGNRWLLPRTGPPRLTLPVG